MNRTRSKWLALAVLAASACSTDTPRESPTSPVHESKSTPALPTIPAASREPADPPAAPPKSERELRVEAIARGHSEAMDAYYGLFRAAKTDEERQKIAETTSAPDDAPFRLRMREVVREDPSDKAAFDALAWLLVQRSGKDDLAADLALLEAQHFARAEMTDVLMALQYADAPAARALLDRIARESPHRNVRGRALLSQAEAVRREADMIAAVQAASEEKDRAPYVAYLGAEEVARLAGLDQAETEARAFQLYERVLRDYADVPAARQGVIGDAAQTTMHEMKDLAVGKTAPEIEGEDIQGAPLKLSDYRGRVVMLDFWGNW